MKPYTERALDVVSESKWAVFVLLNPDNTDLEFWTLRPVMVDPTTTPEEFTARQLRPVGVFGMTDGPETSIRARVAFKEPLNDVVVGRLGAAFAEYMRVMFRAEEQTAEVAELERLYLLPDTRPN